MNAIWRQCSPRAAMVMIAALIAASATGCSSAGPGMAVVSGKVTYQGKPLEQGTVSFHPTDPLGTPASGPISKDGTYSLTTRETGDGAQLGEYKVSVVAIAAEVFNNDLPGAVVTLPKSTVPKQYESPATSGLTAKVVAGTNNHNFDLK